MQFFSCNQAMKIAHLFLVAVSFLLLASSGFAFIPRKTRECYIAGGVCRFFKCSFPLKQYGKCGLIRKCCISARV
ncbi:beta-defensin 14-like [Sceloporus undulatus]|uniref:beta-defensin 14-like n=1 Tax=Sceloporus undulatus TaxID=8520 RepID=UPI001C4CCD8C|nr:beta-defensin 14-like [Sceloporus undulatus]